MRFAMIFGAALMLCGNALAADATLKIASLAPDGSLWMKEMRAAGDAVARDTEGRVAIKFYPGGVMGNDATVLRKMRLGQLQGGAFTGSELTLVYKDAQIYSLPFLFQDYSQVDAVRSKVDPVLIAGFEKSGYRIVGISGVGFAYLMGTRPLATRDDLKQAKVWVPQNDRIAELTFQAGGIEPIPLPLGDVFTALQTGLVDTVGNTTAGSIALQWHTKVTQLFDLPLSYVVGYVAIDGRAFGKLQPADQAVVNRAFSESAARIDAGNRRADADARAVLEKQGVKATVPSAEDVAYWKQIGTQVIDKLLAEDALSQDVLTAVQGALVAPAPAAAATAETGTR
jgi:TRAP-type transport system periplasmic protein